MNKRIPAVAALLLATATTDLSVNPEPPVQPALAPSQTAVVASARSSVTEAIAPKKQYLFGELKPEVPEPLILKQDEAIRRQLAFVNTRAISCGSWKNELCLELEAQKIPVAHLISAIKSSTLMFANSLENLESYQAFEERIVTLLQPEGATAGLSYEQRLNNATEILARSSLGVYQLLYRYYAGHLKQSFHGAEGRENMFRLISSKEKQDELAEIIIRDLGRKYGWNIPVMAADYYGGPKLAVPLSKKLSTGTTEFDALLTGKRYHGFPSVTDYIEFFEGNIAQFAANEGLDPNSLSEKDKVRLFRYAIAQRESSFDMQSFERDQQKKK